MKADESDKYKDILHNKNLLLSQWCKYGLVGYDASFTRMRSCVRFTVFVIFLCSLTLPASIGGGGDVVPLLVSIALVYIK